MGCGKMSEVEKIFGVEEFEQFKIKYKGTTLDQYFHFSEDGLEGPMFRDELDNYMCSLLSGECTLVKLPEKTPQNDWIEYDTNKACEGCKNKSKCILFYKAQNEGHYGGVVKVYSPGDGNKFVLKCPFYNKDVDGGIALNNMFLKKEAKLQI